jgi:hypothetical protein
MVHHRQGIPYETAQPTLTPGSEMSKDKKKLPPKETETVWENGKLVEKSLAEDPSIDALVEEHSAIDPDPWRAAYGALLDAEEAEPLAAMLAGSTPIPRWVRAGLAHLLDHTSGYDVGPDRLVFTRTQATRRAIETNKKRIRVGAAVLAHLIHDGRDFRLASVA